MTTTRDNYGSGQIWIYGGDHDDDSHRDDPRRKCLHQQGIYYSYEPEDLARARDLCAGCPVFRQCVRWGLAHFDEIPYGIMFGLTEVQRRRISEGLEDFRDWRRDWSRAKYTAALARAYEKKIQRLGRSKREENDAGKPCCPRGHTRVRRGGRNVDGVQKYRCRECGATFLGEEL